MEWDSTPRSKAAQVGAGSVASLVTFVLMVRVYRICCTWSGIGQVLNTDWVDGLMDGGMDTWMDGWVDGWRDGWMQGWMGGSLRIRRENS